MTRWSPDTCGCEIEYDDDLKVVEVFKKCAKHAHTSDDATHFQTVLAHNRTKNAALNATHARMKEGGSTALPEHVGAFYDYDDNLHIIGSGLSPTDQELVKGKIGASPALHFDS